MTCWIYLLITILVRDCSNMVKLFIAASQAWSLMIKQPIQESKKHLRTLLSLFLLVGVANLTTSALIMENHTISVENSSFSSEVSFCGMPDTDEFKFLWQLETALVSTRYFFFCVCIVITEIGIRNLRKVRLRFIPASQIQAFMRNSNPITVSTARAVMITNSMMLLCYTMYLINLIVCSFSESYDVLNLINMFNYTLTIIYFHHAFYTFIYCICFRSLKMEVLRSFRAATSQNFSSIDLLS